MRSVQDRIMLILSHFGKERIEALFKNEDLFFAKGCLFSTDKGGQSCSIAAHFSLSETSYASHDFAFDAFRNRFKTPLSNVENDETKILRIEIYDRNLMLYKSSENLKITKKDFYDNNLDVFNVMNNLVENNDKSVFLLKADFEEFDGIVSEFHTLIFRFDNFREYHFKTKTLDLKNDDLFISFFQSFLKDGFNYHVSIEEIKSDFSKVVDNIPTILEYPEFKNQ